MFNAVRKFFSRAGYVYEPAGSKCLPNDPHTGTLAVMDELLHRVPGTTNLGTYLCKEIRGSNSLSLHSVYRAGDTGCPSQTGETSQGLAVVALLTLHASELQIQEIIHARKRWQVGQGWKPFNGPDPHWNHVHWSLTHWGAAQSAAYVKSVFDGSQPPAPTPDIPKDQDMFFARRSDSNTIWLVVPGGKVGISNPKELAANQKALKDAGFNANVVLFPVDKDNNVGTFLDKLPTLA